MYFLIMSYRISLSSLLDMNLIFLTLTNKPSIILCICKYNRLFLTGCHISLIRKVNGIYNRIIIRVTRFDVLKHIRTELINN